MSLLAQWGSVLVVLAIVFGVYVSWGIGANDVANAWGAAVGSGAIGIAAALALAAVFEFTGAVVAGGNVTDTLRMAIVDSRAFSARPDTFVLGMLAALLAAAIWLTLATGKGWPVSTTHSIVGAIVGFALVAAGPAAVNWDSLYPIIGSWVLSPLLGGAIAYALMVSIRVLVLDTRDPFDKAKTWGPVYIFLVGWIVSLITLFKGMGHLKFDLSANDSVLLATAIGLTMAFAGKLVIGRIQANKRARKGFYFEDVEKVFVPPMLVTACAMAFAHGSNDVGNGLGPIAAVMSMVEHEPGGNSILPLWLLVLGGSGIVAGLLTLGYRVMRTLGSGITELTPTRGYCATLAAATTVVLASKTGLPVSTTHVAVGAVMGVGLARGLRALDLRVIGNILMAWLVTLPVAVILSAVLYLGFTVLWVD